MGQQRGSVGETACFPDPPVAVGGIPTRQSTTATLPAAIIGIPSHWVLESMSPGEMSSTKGQGKSTTTPFRHSRGAHLFVVVSGLVLYLVIHSNHTRQCKCQRICTLYMMTGTIPERVLASLVRYMLRLWVILLKRITESLVEERGRGLKKVYRFDLCSKTGSEDSSRKKKRSL